MTSTVPRSSRNPALSIFDTGEVLEPHASRDGTVDFDNDESSTVLQVKATRSETKDATTDLEVIGFGPGLVEIFIGGKSVWCGDGETGEVAPR